MAVSPRSAPPTATARRERPLRIAQSYASALAKAVRGRRASTPASAASANAAAKLGIEALMSYGGVSWWMKSSHQLGPFG